MSSSSRKRGTNIAVAATLATAATGVSSGAEVYYQPIASLSSTYNTNANLDPGGGPSAMAYFADAATNIGIATKTSDTFLQPRLTYQYFPTLAGRNRLEAFMNLNSTVTWQRDRFAIYGFFDHRDDVNAEQPPAEFNNVNPGLGTTNSTTGRTTVGVTRNYTMLDPQFVHQLTPLSSLGFSGEYQRMDYSPSDTGSHIPFNYYVGRLFYSQKLNQRTDFNIGAYGSRYVSGSIDSHSNSGGIQAGGSYNWSPVLRSDLTLQVQRTQLQERSPHVFDQTSTPWAATFNTVYSTQLSSYRLVLGRTLYPSSAGGLYTTDQIRGQYDRDLGARTHFTGALRYFRDRTTAGVTSNETRNYATSFLRLQYMLTKSIYLAGSYSYTYQKYHSDRDPSTANIVSVSVGYQGLQRQR